MADLARGYRARQFTPVDVINQLYARIDRHSDRAIWTGLLPQQQVLEQAYILAAANPDAYALYGIPFAIKDNIDLADCPTTAACPDFAYVPSASAFVVTRLIEAGAIPIGKTNLDQFATGLVGTRSPYGICRNSFNPDYISGGSSSGSALAVAHGLCSFALGTDTAGSGRVPAAFNNLIGLKPTVGRLSPRGMVPACRTLDTISIFALTAEDAASVCRIAEGFDVVEPYSRARDERSAEPALQGPFRFGVPHAEQLQFFGNEEYPRLFDAAVAALERLGGQRVLIDFAPYQEAAELLYDGPWLAERYVAVEALLRRSPQSLWPLTRQIIERGASLSAAQSFRAHYRLQALRRRAQLAWQDISVMLLPTAGTIYRIAEVEADPLRTNTRLGFYTNFMNLLDLAGVAVPAGFTDSQLPFGVTLAGPAWSDYSLLSLASRLHRTLDARQGALSLPIAGTSAFDWMASANRISIAVCGAHMQGLPLNHQLLERNAVLLSCTKTAPQYRLYALPGGPPHRPGLMRAESGSAIEVEIWSLPSCEFASFVAAIPAPLGIGRIRLADGSEVSGFLCEGHATVHAEDITPLGGWRAYLAVR